MTSYTHVHNVKMLLTYINNIGEIMKAIQKNQKRTCSKADVITRQTKIKYNYKSNTAITKAMSMILKIEKQFFNVL